MSLSGNAKDQLRQFIEKIESLTEEKKALQGDIADTFAEAKSTGFDVKTMRNVLRLRKLSKIERRETLDFIDVYMHALGMLDDEPPPDNQSALDLDAPSGAKH